jgi:hypothetical protein
MSAKLAAVATAMAMAMALACVPGCNTTEIDRAGSGPMAFASTADAKDDGAQGATVILRSRSLLLTPAGQVVVDVVARGAADLHGAAFRVTWDPAALSFVEAQSGPAWSKEAIALAKEGTPGQLAVVWTEKGETSHDATGETVLGTLTFALVSRKSTALAFMNERAKLVDKSGAPVDVTWRGGTVAAR